MLIVFAYLVFISLSNVMIFWSYSHSIDNLKFSTVKNVKMSSLLYVYCVDGQACANASAEKEQAGEIETQAFWDHATHRDPDAWAEAQRASQVHAHRRGVLVYGFYV